MIKTVIISAFIASVLIYISTAFYFYNQEKKLQSTFLENIKNDTRAEFIVNGFKDTLVNDRGDTVFINIPANIASTDIASYQKLQDTSKTN